MINYKWNMLCFFINMVIRWPRKLFSIQVATDLTWEELSPAIIETLQHCLPRMLRSSVYDNVELGHLSRNGYDRPRCLPRRYVSYLQRCQREFYFAVLACLTDESAGTAAFRWRRHWQ